MSKSYETLTGALGKAAFYRPARLTLKEVLSEPSRATLVVNGISVRPADVSLNGFSFWADAAAEEGTRVEYDFAIDGKSVLAGRGTVARSSSNGRGYQIGIAAKGGVLDYEQLHVGVGDSNWRRGLATASDPIGSLVPAGYKAILNEMAAFCVYYRELLARREEQLMGSNTDDAETVARIVAEEVYPTLSSAWIGLSDKAGAASVAALQDQELHNGVRYATEALVTSQILEAPVIARSFDKPLGYPGDYRVMEYYFDNDFRGDTAFAKIFHRMSTEHPLAAGVRARSEWVAGQINEFLETTKETAYPARVLSLGSGTAYEVDFLHRQTNYPRPVTWTLIDQEDAALTTSYKRTRALVDDSKQRLGVDCIHIGFSQLRTTSLSDSLGEQEFIFSTGLFDYLKEPLAQLLVRQLYDMLHPDGGTLVIGNAAWPNTHFWGPEFTLRWSLIYRTEEQMRALAAFLPKEADISVINDPTSAYWLLRCAKPRV